MVSASGVNRFITYKKSLVSGKAGLSSYYNVFKGISLTLTAGLIKTFIFCHFSNYLHSHHFLKKINYIENLLNYVQG